MAVGCAACGAPLASGARFCAQCGTPVDPTAVGAAAPGTPPPNPSTSDPAGSTSERKLVSVLFADLVGFTSLAEGRDAEAVRDLLSTYFERCQEVIGRYGGTVEKFIGDAVMAVWGAPIAHENDAERAVRAALDLLEEVRTLGPGLQARAGVLTGEAAVTIGATNQGLVAGDIVNTASRLQSVAQPGTVLVGERTEQAANSAVAFEPAGEQELKGKVAPVPAFRAVRVIAERGGRGRTDGLEAPFIGRDDEYRLLRDLVHATTRDKRPRMVSIMGVAGVGKSRMAWELSKYLDGVVESIYWHGGRSPAYGEGITFWALGEMVRGRLGLVEGDDEAATRAAVGRGVETWLQDDQERRWVERALLALLGAESPTGVAREELFSAWRTFFERIAEQGTVVLVFEDLHWADAGLLDFIDHLLDWSTGKPIIVVTLARPELLERRPEWGAGRRTFVGIALEPLPADRVGEILEALAPGLPSDGVAAIVDRADGIPLYAVETVRMLVAEGRLVAEDGRYRPAGDLSELAVPATLQALIAARLDALEPADRVLHLRCRRARPELHRCGPRRGQRPRGRGPAGAPALARPPRAARRPDGSALARAWPVRVRPGAGPRGGLRHAVPARSARPPPGRGPLLREPRRGGAGRGPRLPLPRGLSRVGRRPGRGAGAGGPGAGLAARRRRAGRRARQPRSGDRATSSRRSR